MKKFIFVSLILTACAFDRNDTSNSNQAQLRQNEIIVQTYGDLVGTYNGTLKTASGNETVILIIDIGNEPYTNPNGTPGTKKVPLAIFKRNSSVVANYYLSPGGYIRETGDLFLTNNNNGGAGDDITSIETKFLNGQITGRVLTKAGTLGTINLKFYSKETTIPGSGIANEFRERIIKQYKAIAGEYVGNINSKEGIPISITLNVIEGSEMPMITGYFRRFDMEGYDLGLTVSYLPDTAPPKITMNGNGGGRYIITIDGSVQNGVISGTFNSLAQGYLGTVIVKKRK